MKSCTLVGRARCKLALPWPGRPVDVGLLRADFLHTAFDADLSALGLPVQCKRRVRIAAQLATLAAARVGEEDEATLVNFFQQDEPNCALATPQRRRKCHRLVVWNSEPPSFIEPANEFYNRIVSALRHSQVIMPWQHSVKRHLQIKLTEPEGN